MPRYTKLGTINFDNGTIIIRVRAVNPEQETAELGIEATGKVHTVTGNTMTYTPRNPTPRIRQILGVDLIHSTIEPVSEAPFYFEIEVSQGDSVECPRQSDPPVTITVGQIDSDGWINLEFV